MAWSTPRTWVAGEQVTASIMNTYVRDEFSYLKDSPTFDGSVTITSALSIGTTLAVTGATTLSSTLTAPAVRGLCQGRLTLTSGTPVTVSDVTAAGTLYFTPYTGNQVALYDGSTAWTALSFSEISIAVPAVANQVYDVFVYNNSGTAALELLAWTNDTTRATALTKQDGVYVKTGATTRRYLGTVRTKTASQLNDSVLFRHVWNYYNRVPRSLVVSEPTSSWNYTTATVRQAFGNAANQVDIVIGVQEVPLDLMLTVTGVNDAANPISVGIGEGSTTTYTMGAFNQSYSEMTARLVKYPAVGRQFYSWNEWSTAAGTTTFFGTATTGSTTAGGLRGVIEG